MDYSDISTLVIVVVNSLPIFGMPMAGGCGCCSLNISSTPRSAFFGLSLDVGDGGGDVFYDAWYDHIYAEPYELNVSIRETANAAACSCNELADNLASGLTAAADAVRRIRMIGHDAYGHVR